MMISDVSVKRPVFAIMMTAALIVLGAVSYESLGLDLMPKTDAAVVNEGAFGKLTGALTGESERAEELIRLIGAYLYQSRRARTGPETEPEDPRE